MAQEKNVQSSDLLQLPGEDDLSLDVISCCVESREALDLLEKLFAHEALKISHERQAVVHVERHQRVLSEDMQSGDQGIVARLCPLSKQAMQVLCTTAPM